MNRKHSFALLMTLLAAQAVYAQSSEIVVQQPPPLPGVYAGGVALDCEPPAYPMEAQRYELEGETIVELLIGDDGRAHGKRIAKSSGWQILDETTLSAMAACRFSPVTRNGKPAGAHWQKFSFVWVLENDGSPRGTPPVLLRESCKGADQLELINAPRVVEPVLLRFLTSAEGVAFGIKIEKGSGDAGIDEEAVSLLQSCKFSPSMWNGKPGPGNAIARFQKRG